MPLNCDEPGCSPTLPASMLIDIRSEPGVSQNTDCSTNILYLTDEPGLIDQTDDTSGDYLTVDSRFRQISSTDEVDRHFSKCSRTHYELSQYLNIPEGETLRPPTITVAYFDSEAETMVDAIQDIYSCYTCFYTVTHVAYDKSGTALYGTDDQLDLAAWADVNFIASALPTINPALKTPTETESNAYKSKQAGHSRAVYQWLAEECVYVLDDNCEPTGERTNVYGAHHLLTAGVMTSVSMSGNDALFNVHASPLGAPAIDGFSTARLSEQETWDVTGYNAKLGGVQNLNAHHVNVYHNINGHRMIYGGLTATGRPIEEIVFERYIRDTLNNKLIELLVENKAVSMLDDSATKAKLTSVIRGFIRKKIIPDTPNAIDKSKFKNIYMSGNGWVLEKDSVTSENVKNRAYPALRFCAATPDLTNSFSISICGGA